MKETIISGIELLRDQSPLVQSIKNKKYVPVLTIAGADSGGGAGIQADLKTFSALGCYGMSVITATTAQNTLGVKSIHDIPVDHIVDQLHAVLSDITPGAIKIGMLNRPEVVYALAEELRDYPEIPVVLDPVMVATSGDKLIKDETIALLKSILFPLSHIVTPNLDEATVLVGTQIENLEGMKQAAKDILQYGSEYVLVKGGHLIGDKVKDVFMGKAESAVFGSGKIKTENMHGTGCTLSSAIAAFLSRGLSTLNSVIAAREYLIESLESGKDVLIGQGNGALNHFHQPEKLIKNDLD